MHTRFDIRDVKSLTMEKDIDDEEGLSFKYSMTVLDFPDVPIQIPLDEFIRLTRSFSRRIGKEIIEA